MSSRLLVQPDDSVQPVVAAIDGAKQTIDLCVFKLDHDELEASLASAVERGVAVRALVAHASSEKQSLRRKLEHHLLDIGVAVSRTDDELLRYHGKMMIVDGQQLFVLGYNFTVRDIDESRSLGVMIDDATIVREAIRLFEADFERRTYSSAPDNLVVSPLNSRTALLSMIEGAENTLLIYDQRLSDELMRNAIAKRARAGVEVRIIGKLKKEIDGVQVERIATERLHVRAIVQDDRRVFVGSQSLRRSALERRREIGVIMEDTQLVHDVTAIFEHDWAEATGKAPRRSVAAVA